MLPDSVEIEHILSGIGLPDSVLVRGPVGPMDCPAIIACALPYLLEDDPEPEAGEAPFGVIACFARTHHYRILAERLMTARDTVIALTRSSGSGSPSSRDMAFSKAGFPIHVNSRLDEKSVAVLAGLGGIGLNSLLITEKSGCACVLGVMGLPFVPEGSADAASGPSLLPDCPSCRACARACPAGAIRESGGIDPELCLQAYMSGDRPVPPSIAEIWGGRLYGCDECIRACPRSRGSQGPNLNHEEKGKGRLGAKIDLESILRADDASLKERLKGTALGLSWLRAEKLKRNAALALWWRESGREDR